MEQGRKGKKKSTTPKPKEELIPERDDGVFASCTFSSLGLHPTLCEQLKERLGFEAPTRVQAEAIPVVLSGRHVMVNAATGTGKTVAYLAPIVHVLQGYDSRIQRSDGTFALVLVPTHELCMQVFDVLQKLLHRFHWIVPGYLMGGENRSKEKARLRKGISILVATPGRLLDHLKHTSSFLYKNLRWIVFDEADRILQLGFGKEIEEILNLLGSRTEDASGGKSTSSGISGGYQRQNLLFSATLNEKVNHLAKISLENPVSVGLDNKKQPHILSKEVGSSGHDNSEEQEREISTIGDYKLPAQLIQRYVKVPCGSRLPVLLSVLKHLFERDVSSKIVVFFSTCDAVDFHYNLLKGFRWSPSSQKDEANKNMFLSCKSFRLHGNMKQEDRRSTFQSFKVEKSALLLSTDVAARGLDFPKVNCIIQYDSPGEATEYVHRVGRTARLDKIGEALLFLQPAEIDYLQDLQKHGVSLSEYPILKVLDSSAAFGRKGSGKGFVSLDLHPSILSVQKAVETFILYEPSIHMLAKNAYCSWVRAYAAHRGDLKRIFMVKKLHLGHVAKSFALKEQPSLVGQTFQKLEKKRKRDQKQKGAPKRRKISHKK
ncbi:hypothetical protein MLD38_006196 [Melastoma candidum]|uniref:Uncharacterized protein n=1 Tax=Melastoma candidum TaxID=119954 RepID=A0ACB9RM46_9MYRT|nr:hypothetical protein MLD38_006196 [Melastoma candidum]